jgi:DNA polymerase-4
MDRIILHSDLNSFYASVECLYNPGLRDKPVAVCGSQSTRHGIVLAKNEIAKKYGVKTGEAIWEARSRCPGLVVVPPHYSLYLRFSALATDIYRSYTDLVEPFGIDECWLDVTKSSALFGSGITIAEEIRKRIKRELGITVSVGVSFNKIFAKLGSDMKKPDAVTAIDRENFTETIWPLPVRELIYVGRATERKLNRVGIYTIGDLAQAPGQFLTNLLGKWGGVLRGFANGWDTSPVSRFNNESPIKSIGNSLTTPRDLVCDEDAKTLIYVLSDSVGERLRRHNLKGKTVQVSVRAADLTFMERQTQIGYYTNTSSEIAEKAFDLFADMWNWPKNIRQMGVRVTDLVTADDYVQLSLFPDDRRINRELLDRSIDEIRRRFGHYSVQRAFLLRETGEKSLNANPVEENVIHPVALFRGPI